MNAASNNSRKFLPFERLVLKINNCTKSDDKRKKIKEIKRKPNCEKNKGKQTSMHLNKEVY